jgi:molybdopterin biosynthesis enzyme MoaB
MSVFVEGMGVATGIAFDGQQNLYVGDRSGTVFKISPDRQIFVFATLEPSIAAYHLAFGPDGYLYVAGPTTSSFDSIHRISSHGEVEVFYRGLGRPQGLAFDDEGRLYVAASIAGRKGVVRIDPDRRAELFLSGPGIIGLAFTPSRAMVVATTNAIYRVDVADQGPPAHLMNAEIIAVGSEMLTPERVDTNSLYLTGELNNLGVEVVAKCVVGDHRDRLADAIRQARERSPIVILSGGLGPTEDDVTREAVALALGRKLVFIPKSPRRWSAVSRGPGARWPRSTSARLSSSKAPSSFPTTAAPRPASGSRNPLPP